MRFEKGNKYSPKIPWNKGLTKEDPRVAKYGQKGSIARKGMKPSEETRKKLSDGQKKRAPISEETRQKLKIWGIGNKYGVGNKGRFKKGHLSPNKGKRFFKIQDRTKLKRRDDKHSSAYNEWRKNVYQRDIWKCRLKSDECCGRIEAHHIFNWVDYPELRYIISNGITLCHFHHPLKWSEEERMIPIFQELINK